MDISRKHKFGIIILSRYSSSRLPGKALKQLHGKPLLGYLIDRLRSVLPQIPIILATSVEPSDDPIAAFAKEWNVECFRGSLDNVALRFLQAAEAHGLDYAIRVTGDSLFIDARIIQELLHHVSEEDYVLLSNRKHQMYPVGQTVEIVSVPAFRTLYHHFSTAEDFEHVTHFFYTHEEHERLKLYHHRNPDGRFRDISLAIDTPEDFSTALEVVMELGDNMNHSTYDQVYELYARHQNAQRSNNERFTL